MALETATYISDLVSTNPTASDNISQGDDHIRLLKATVKATFPNITGAVTPTHTELNYVSGVTSAIQTQLNTKASLAGTETLTNKTLTTPVLSGTASGVTAGRLGYLSGVVSYGDGANQRTVVNTDEAQTLTNKTLGSGTAISSGTINGASVGATTPSTGAFTTLSASSTVSGAGFSTYLASPPAIGGTTPAAGTFTTLADSAGNVRSVPQNSQTASYTLAASDNGKHISITTGGVTIPSGVFAAGDAVTIFNNSATSQTITQGASTTLRQSATANTGNRTLAQYGVCTVLCVASNVFVISGSGVS